MQSIKLFEIRVAEGGCAVVNAIQIFALFAGGRDGSGGIERPPYSLLASARRWKAY